MNEVKAQKGNILLSQIVMDDPQIVCSADVLVIQLSRETDLAHQLLEDIGAVGELRSDRFERDVLPPLGIFRLEDISSLAAGEETHDSEAAGEDVARRE